MQPPANYLKFKASTQSPQGHFWPQKLLPVGQGTCNNTGPVAGHLGLLQREQMRGKTWELQAGVSWGPGMSGGQGAATPAGIALSRALTWGPLLMLESESPNGQKCSSQNAQNRKRKKHSSGPIRRWLPKGVGWQDPAQAQARWQVGGALHCQAGTAGGGGDLTPSLTAAQQEGKLRPRPSREASAGGGAALPPPSSSGQPQLPHNVEAQPWSQRAPTRDVGPPSHCRTLVLGATLCPEDPQAAARGGDWATQALWARVGPPGIWTETPPPLALFHPCALAAGAQTPACRTVSQTNPRRL